MSGCQAFSGVDETTEKKERMKFMEGLLVKLFQRNNVFSKILTALGWQS